MLLNEDQIKDLVNRIIEKAKGLIERDGEETRDEETGLVCTECRISRFILIEHQRQQVKNGFVNTNGLDIWMIEAGGGKKVLSVNYMPFEIKSFNKAGKAPWIDELMSL